MVHRLPLLVCKESIRWKSVLYTIFLRSYGTLPLLGSLREDQFIIAINRWGVQDLTVVDYSRCGNCDNSVFCLGRSQRGHLQGWLISGSCPSASFSLASQVKSGSQFETRWQVYHWRHIIPRCSILSDVNIIRWCLLLRLSLNCRHLNRRNFSERDRFWFSRHLWFN